VHKEPYTLYHIRSGRGALRAPGAPGHGTARVPGPMPSVEREGWEPSAPLGTARVPSPTPSVNLQAGCAPPPLTHSDSTASLLWPTSCSCMLRDVLTLPLFHLPLLAFVSSSWAAGGPRRFAVGGVGEEPAGAAAPCRLSTTAVVEPPTSSGDPQPPPSRATASRGNTTLSSSATADVPTLRRSAPRSGEVAVHACVARRGTTTCEEVDGGEVGKRRRRGR